MHKVIDFKNNQLKLIRMEHSLYMHPLLFRHTTFDWSIKPDTNQPTLDVYLKMAGGLGLVCMTIYAC
jgi:hypothetical protein